MCLIAIAIKFLSKGPILYKQERVGCGGRVFTCFKFRSMKMNASTTHHQRHLKQLMRSQVPMTKMDAMGDSRLIPFGSLLRASGRGEMSLVGPRPCTPYEYSEYLPWQKARFEALPGLTGLWQVSGKNKTTFEEMVRLDIQYARNQNLALDLKIMFKTAPALLAQLREARGKKRRHQSEEQSNERLRFPRLGPVFQPLNNE
jgi:lipopolysaccharide/colanic/teichoic acid biosynthesis glycosyltransferase